MIRTNYKILVIAPAWVGDIVMMEPMIGRIYKKHNASCQIDVLVSGFTVELVSRILHIHDIIVNPFVHGKLNLFKRFRFGRALAQNNYDECYVLPNSFKSALIAFFAGIKTRIGFVGEMRYGLLNRVYKLDKQKLPLMIERFLALANSGQKPSQITYPKLQAYNNPALLLRLELNLTKSAVCLCPAAEFGPAKRWPARHFATLADLLQSAGYQVWILGGVNDLPIALDIISKSRLKKYLINLCGKTNLVHVVDLMASSLAVISNDTGLMHIACSIGKPVVALYGSSSPKFTPPLALQAKILSLELECAPCFSRTCKFGHYNCLEHLEPISVFNELNILLKLKVVKCVT